MSQFCPKCGKEAAKNAGSVTAFFFQHNYCQCHVKVSQATQKFEQRSICTRCGKSIRGSSKAGSFTGYLFKELRCQCLQPRIESKPVRKLSSTAMRARRFTEAIGKVNTSNWQGTLQRGTTVGGAFQILSTIGEGGMGIVYLARQVSMARDCALKVLTPELVNEQNWLRFKAEAKILSALMHPTLVKVYDLGIHENRLPFYAMDYLQGRTLEDLLIDDGPLELNRAIEIFLPVLDGLAYAHRHQIIHRDVKPANIFLCSNGEIKILDFGISKLSGEGQQQLTRAGEIFGSPFYMSPEQCRGDVVDHRSDIYSVACSLMESLTCHVPFEADSSIDIALKHQEEEIPLLSDLSTRAFPPSIDIVLAKALAKMPQDRYQSAKELELDLQRILEGKTVVGHSPSKRITDRPNAPLSPWLLLSAIGIICLATLSWGLIHFSTPTQTAVKKPSSTDFEQSAAAILQQSIELDDSAQERPFDPDLAARVKKYLLYAPDFYSQVVKRDGHDLKIFSFPSFSIGRLSFNREGKIYEFDAVNKVGVPANIRLTFTARGATFEYPELMQHFRSNDFKHLIFWGQPSQPDKLWSVIGTYTDLGVLSLSEVPLSQRNLPNLNRLNRLTGLSLDKTVTPSTLLTKVVALNQVEALSFVGGGECTSVFKLLTGNKKLHYLTIHDAVLSDQDLAILSTMSQLRHLSLPHSNLTNASVGKLSKLTQLQGLDLYNTRVNQNALPVLRKFTHLEHLRLSAFDWTAEEEEKFKANFPKLRNLDF